ncbi:MAG: helix-turn-helix domain-containing protein [Bacteroidales bacterium]|nr:helix-turn-helix domain-containing protein [Bacteroidales bacterium]
MRPLLSYFGAQEIPAALVTFVSLLLFIQTGTSPALSTCYSALLSLPWVLKGVMQRADRKSLSIAANGRVDLPILLRRQRLSLLCSELVIVLLLLLLSSSLSPNSPLFRLFDVGGGGGQALFCQFFLLSLATAWHEVAADNYYHDGLRPSLRLFYDVPRLFVSQGMVVATYGMLIILVGTLQVLSRSIYVGWTTACVILAGIMGLFFVWHLLAGLGHYVKGRADKKARDVKKALHAVRHAPSMGVALSPSITFLLFLFFLPQALMFHTRVLFLLAPVEKGGLSRSLQEVGFVHGVVGALAFSMGIVLSRILVRRRMSRKTVGRHKVRYSQYALPKGSSLLTSVDGRMLLRFLPLLLSPSVYCFMTWFPPRMLWQLALCTFMAQFMFGYGMHRLLSFLGLPASVGLRVPIVALCVFVPMAVSGCLVQQMGFRSFYIMNTLCGLLPVLAVLLLPFIHQPLAASSSRPLPSVPSQQGGDTADEPQTQGLSRRKASRTLLCLLSLLLFCLPNYAQWDRQLFRRIDMQDGLNDNSVQHILQLPDNRMAITTRKSINIYDGSRFRYISPANGVRKELPAYYGAYHVYVDGCNLLWVKDFQHVQCFDLRHFSYIEDIDSVLATRGADGPAQDLFVDSKHHLWLVAASGKMRRMDGVPLELVLPADKGSLQDMDVTDDGVYLFFSSSAVVCYDAMTGKKRYESVALNAVDAPLYDSSSLVVKGDDGRFYQLRDGDGGGICLAFDTTSRQWSELFRCTEILHTICVAPSLRGMPLKHAYVTSETRMRQIDLESMQVSEISQINLDGKSISSERMNTVFSDSQGGLWLGAYNDGLLYSHPALVDGAFIPQTLSPLLTDVTVCGMKLHCGDEWMPMSEAYTHELSLPSSQNTLLLEFTALNYSVPLATIFYYKVYPDGTDEDSAPWTEATYGNGAVGKDGILHVQLENLKPGRYHLVVRAGSDTESSSYRLVINIESPWWVSLPAVIAFFAIFLLLVAVLSYLIHRRYRRDMKMKYEEKILLTRLQTLIERFEMEAMVSEGATDEENVDGETDEFVRKAVMLVEKNIGVRGYNVEQLSRDMCMERTGLYKRMTELMDKTPSLFIRSIRLQKAASLLMKGDLSVTEVAEQTGFSSSSHMSRCFQAEWGCTPMEYVRKHSLQQKED